jgi:raffinose/stachyose/melibiose transport system substrate-binding protein
VEPFSNDAAPGALDAYERLEFLKRAGRLAGGAVLAGHLVTAGSALAAEKLTLSVWYLSQSPAEIKAVEAYSKRYANANGLDVDMSPYTFDGINKAMPLALRSRRGPDVAYTNPGIDNTVKFGKNGLLLDLTKVAKQRGWNKRIPQGLIDYVNAPDNRTWGIPYDVVSVGNFYNKAIFDKLNLKPPKTIAGYEAMLAKIKAAGITPFAVGGKDFTATWMWDQLIHTMMPHAYMKRLFLLDPKVTWNTPATVRALGMVQDWSEKGYFQDNFLSQASTDADNLFMTGETAIVVTGSWQNSNFVENAKFPVRFFATPRVSRSLPWHMGGFTPNNAWVVPKFTKNQNQDEALDYVDYVLGEQVARDLWKTGDLVAYRFKTPPPTKNPLQRDVYLAMQQTQVGFYNLGSTNQQLQDTISIFQELITSRITPKEAAEKIDASYKKAAKG